MVHDVIFLLVALVFFAATVLFVHACERLVGPGPTLEEQER
jgi:hypothetical protein